MCQTGFDDTSCPTTACGITNMSSTTTTTSATVRDGWWNATSITCEGVSSKCSSMPRSCAKGTGKLQRQAQQRGHRDAYLNTACGYPHFGHRTHVGRFGCYESSSQSMIQGQFLLVGGLHTVGGRMLQAGHLERQDYTLGEKCNPQRQVGSERTLTNLALDLGCARCLLWHVVE